MTAHFFKDGAEARRWFHQHHARESELLVGFWKVAAGKPGAGYQAVLDEALCVGWIDGIRKGRDAERPSYQKTVSYWVMTAKKDETRRRRLEQLIACCEKGEWLPQYRWAKK